MRHGTKDMVKAKENSHIYDGHVEMRMTHTRSYIRRKVTQKKAIQAIQWGRERRGDWSPANSLLRVICTSSTLAQRRSVIFFLHLRFVLSLSLSLVIYLRDRDDEGFQFNVWRKRKRKEDLFPPPTLLGDSLAWPLFNGYAMDHVLQPAQDPPSFITTVFH